MTEVTHTAAKREVEGDDDDFASIKPLENAWALKVPTFQKGDMKHHLLEVSKFEVMFPSYREKYLKEAWPILTKVLKEHGIKAELNLLDGVMTVATTKKTWDPYIIIKARDVIKLLARSVPLDQALKVLNDNISCEIIKIKNIVQKKSIFAKRRERLIGPNGSTLKTLELLTDCYVMVQGYTVCAVGPYKGIREVMRIVTATLKNVHPINILKTLMVKRTLAKEEEMKEQDWAKYMPSYATNNVKRKKPKKIHKKKPYTPFPPQPVDRKEDENMESGRFFLEHEENQYSKKRKFSSDNPAMRKKIKREDFIPPKEPSFISQSIPSSSQTSVNIRKIKNKIKNKRW